MSALQSALSHGKLSFGRAIVEAWEAGIDVRRGVPVRRVDEDDPKSAFVSHAGETPLHMAVRRYDADLVALLLRVAHAHGVAVNVPKPRAPPPVAAVADGADKSGNEKLQDQGHTPLHVAARYLSGDIRVAVLKVFAEYPDIRFDEPTLDERKQTVAHILYSVLYCEHGRVSKAQIAEDPCVLVKELAKTRARVCGGTHDLGLWSTDVEGIAPLHYLCRTETGTQLSLDMFLAEKPESLNLKTSCGDTPLSFALRNYDIQTSLNLLKLGSDVNGTVTFAVDGSAESAMLRTSAFRFCLRFKLKPLVEWMLERPELDAFQALEDAISESLPEMALRIIAVRNVLLNAADTGADGATASVALRGRLMHLLLRHNAPMPPDSKAEDPTLTLFKTLVEQELADGRPLSAVAAVVSDPACWADFEDLAVGRLGVLQAALFRGHEKIANHLLSHLSAKEVLELLGQRHDANGGRTILHLLALRRQFGMVELVGEFLRRSGVTGALAFVDERDADGRTALHYALSPNLRLGVSLAPAESLLPLLRLGASPTVGGGKEAGLPSVAFLAGTLPKQLADGLRKLLESFVA
ncbi:hypothetical protein HK405_012941, partial [Cladochytrium tenue]